MVKKRLYIGLTLAAKGIETSDGAEIDVNTITHLVLAKSMKDAERKANREAQSHYGKGYSLQTDMVLLADMFLELKRDEGIDKGTDIGALL